MGGDHAPTEVVRGAVDFLRQTINSPDDALVLLVGDTSQIQAELAKLAEEGIGVEPGRLAIVPTSQVVEMDEPPMDAFRQKRDSSLVVCVDMVRRGDADAAFSAGNTGAMMVAATILLERVEGVQRPAIATLMPTEKGGLAVIVDAGANVDCRPTQLLHFALLGSVFAEKALGILNPRVGILANGEEEAKGNELSKEAFALLAAARDRINFLGNVEGNHIFEGKVDVTVCDGFVGNVLLKGAEGAARLAIHLLAEDTRSAPDEATREILLRSLARLRERMDYSEYGGAPLLGVHGVAMIAHGRSDYKAIANGLRQSVRAARSGYVAAVRDALRGAQG
jgi:glycerol-3-phosphate acyltransferase PlsX